MTEQLQHQNESFRDNSVLQVYLSVTPSACLQSLSLYPAACAEAYVGTVHRALVDCYVSGDVMLVSEQ